MVTVVLVLGQTKLKHQPLKDKLKYMELKIF